VQVQGTDRVTDILQVIERHSSNALRIWSESGETDGVNIIWMARGMVRFQQDTIDAREWADKHDVDEEMHWLIEDIRNRFRETGDWFSASVELALRKYDLLMEPPF
jgi:hypothetical protein